MTRDEGGKLVAMYIVAIGIRGLPNSHLWLAIDPTMQDLDAHLLCISVLKDAGIVDEKFNFISLTPKGLEMLTKIEKIMFNTEAKKSEVAAQ